MSDGRRRVSCRFRLGVPESELQRARSCTALPGVETGRMGQSRPPTLVITFLPTASEAEVEAVAAELKALEHATEVTVYEESGTP